MELCKSRTLFAEEVEAGTLLLGTEERHHAEDREAEAFDLRRAAQRAPQELHGGEETLTQENYALSGSSDLLDPSEMPSDSPVKKLNLPKRKPSFSIETTGRNAPCPCGSGKKYKQCHGKDDLSEPGETDSEPK